MKLLQTPIGRIRVIAFLEGISFIALMGIAMPLKYFWDYKHATQHLGMAHGLLFVVYTILLISCFIKYNWSFKTTMLLFIAALLPFGTFIADSKFLKQQYYEV